MNARCTGCRSGPMPSTVVTARPSSAVAGSRQPVTGDAVDQHGARATHALAADELGPGEPEPVAQHLDRGFLGAYVDLAAKPLTLHRTVSVIAPTVASRDHNPSQRIAGTFTRSCLVPNASASGPSPRTPAQDDEQAWPPVRGSLSHLSRSDHQTAEIRRRPDPGSRRAVADASRRKAMAGPRARCPLQTTPRAAEARDAAWASGRQFAANDNP